MKQQSFSQNWRFLDMMVELLVGIKNISTYFGGPSLH
jgi:hypothetical protein